jgi:tryptophanyl-tRNA synthetase
MAIKKAVTDSDRNITFDPLNRPAVSNLLLIAGLCQDRDPRIIADEIGDGGAGTLKKVVTEAINDRFSNHRQRREELCLDQGYLESVLAQGNARANEIAEATLADVRTAMKMSY